MCVPLLSGIKIAYSLRCMWNDFPSPFVNSLFFARPESFRFLTMVFSVIPAWGFVFARSQNVPDQLENGKVAVGNARYTLKLCVRELFLPFCSCRSRARARLNEHQLCFSSLILSALTEWRTNQGLGLDSLLSQRLLVLRQLALIILSCPYSDQDAICNVTMFLLVSDRPLLDRDTFLK